ncbi:hypothetical protein M8818_007467 [Zalaria obscura]|uniref:Uncharacterized protein n=1 Tax=Zalaria obscura TaxID=2024903 RepID=A0ACC3S3A9_9PEZI
MHNAAQASEDAPTGDGALAPAQPMSASCDKSRARDAATHPDGVSNSCSSYFEPSGITTRRSSQPRTIAHERPRTRKRLAAAACDIQMELIVVKLLEAVLFPSYKRVRD